MKFRVLFSEESDKTWVKPRRMQFQLNADWIIDFVCGSEAALAMLCNEPYHILIDKNFNHSAHSSSLLEDARELAPDIVCVELKGKAIKDLNPEYLFQDTDKPTTLFDRNEFTEVLKRSIALKNILENEQLKKLVTDPDTIPSLPEAYIELMEIIQSKNASMNEVGNVIAKDIAMSAKIMQMVNSAFFSLPVVVRDPVHATNLLGLEIIKALVNTVHVFRSFSNQASERFSIEEFTRHSLSVGALAKAIAEQEGQDKEMLDDVFIAGMLHDVGKLIVVSSYPDYYDQSAAYTEQLGLPYVHGEEEIIHATHAEIGAYLLNSWGFRDSIVEAVAYHHRPGDCFASSFTPLTAVHIANAMENEYGESDNPSLPVIHMDYLIDIGLIDKLGYWRETCIKTKHALEGQEV